MMTQRVIVLDDLAKEGLERLESAEGIECVVRTGLKGDDLRDSLREFDGAICRSGVKLTAPVLEDNRRLKAIVRAGVGTDNIDKQAATRLGIVVMNTPAGNTLSTAEHTMAMLLALSRNVAPAYESLCAGNWDRKKYMGTQLSGKDLGIVGLGRIGQAVVARAKAFGMRIIGFDPFLSKQRADELGVELVTEVREMLPRIDYLTVHTPLNDDTRGLIGAAELEAMRPGVRLINCARGGIYDEQALADAIASGRIGGVALDVFAEEPCTDSPLFGLPGVLATPHLGASTEEAQTQVAVEGVELLLDFLINGTIRHSVNVAPLDPKVLEGLRGYLDLAHRLGLFLSQMHRGTADACRLVYRGEVASQDTKLLTSAFAVGLLEHALDEEANLVNSEMLLRERGITVTAENRSDHGAFSSSMMASLDTDNASYRVAGTLFGHTMPRLIELDGHRLEAYLDGTLMIFHHRDVPGIIGTIGTIFASHDVNIAQMAVGRSAPGEEAVGVLNLDSEPPTAAIESVLNDDAIANAQVIQLPAAGELPSWLQS